PVRARDGGVRRAQGRRRPGRHPPHGRSRMNEVKLPRLGQGMESGTIVQWLKSEGEQVAKGEPLYEVDTETGTQEVGGEGAGVLRRSGVPEGGVAVGQTIGFIGEEGEQPPEVAAEPEPKAQEPVAEAAVPQEVPSAPAPVAVAAQQADGRIKASPL